MDDEDEFGGGNPLDALIGGGTATASGKRGSSTGNELMRR